MSVLSVINGHIHRALWLRNCIEVQETRISQTDLFFTPEEKETRQPKHHSSLMYPLFDLSNLLIGSQDSEQGVWRQRESFAHWQFYQLSKYMLLTSQQIFVGWDTVHMVGRRHTRHVRKVWPSLSEVSSNSVTKNSPFLLLNGTSVPVQMTATQTLVNHTKLHTISVQYILEPSWWTQ